MNNHHLNLNALNPLNLVNSGGNKVQHPTAEYSNTISQNVEGMYKDFTVFHKNLKNLVMLCEYDIVIICNALQLY